LSDRFSGDASKRKPTTVRYVFLLPIAVVLPFVLTALGDYLVQAHTRDGRLAMYVVLHSQQLSDEELAHAIGQDPFAVIRRAGLMSSAVVPIAAVLSGIFVVCFETRRPGIVAALVLMPYLLFDFAHMALATRGTAAQTVAKIITVLGTDAAYMITAVIAAKVISGAVQFPAKPWRSSGHRG
jgi:hypothetical protein